jgi:HSP20 family molecular chaperone IbpA
MSRGPMLSSPLLLGFDEIERLIDRLGKGGSDGYPPYNIERIVGNESVGRSIESATVQNRTETLRITLAVAGFLPDQLDVTVEDNQLIVRGKQVEEKLRDFIHRGIATRQFARTFVLADGIEVKSADLSHGLLAIDLIRTEPDRVVRRISIGHGSKSEKKLL